jgi:tetratricopeptide (TPR) repeat protein
VFAGEVTFGMPANNPTDEINTMFEDSKNTNWIIHRMKPHTNSTISDKNLDVARHDDSPQKTAKMAKEPKLKQSESKKEVSDKKEVVEASQQNSKVEKSKEQAEKDKQEEQRRKYRELEELTELNQQAVALYTDNNLDDALASFSKIPEDMRTAEIWLLMGNILMDKGKKDEAVFMYGRAILVDSTYYKAYYNLGNIYLSEDKFNMAIEQFKLATKYNMNNPYSHYNLGCAYLKAGELKKAKYSFIKAVELKNTVPDFHYNLAYVYKKLGKEKQAKIYLENYNKLTGQVN